MLKKVVLAVVILLLVGSAALFFWARSVFTQDQVRVQLAAQMSSALGQPVTVGRIGASIYPRVTVELGDVTIGPSSEIRVQALHVGTDFRALLSRRIEHADLRVDGARIELPLLPLGADTPSAGGPPAADGTPDLGYVELVSIDEVELRNVQLVSGGRTLTADIDAVPKGSGVMLERVAIAADGTTIEARGEIESLAGPTGTLAINAGELDADRFLAFLGAFAAGAISQDPGAEATGQEAANAGDDTGAGIVGPVRLEVTVTADKATSGGLVLDDVSANAVVTSGAITLDSLGFGLFDGRCDGSLVVSMTGETPHVDGRAVLKNVDMAALAGFAGTGDVISGRLSGTVQLAGSGSDLASAMKSAIGTARVDLTDGVIAHLNLVRNVVLATSGRAGSSAEAVTATTGGEKFTRLGATLSIAQGRARTNDLRFESPDVELDATGGMTLDGSAVALEGRVQLSEALSAQAGRDLVRYTAEGGRVTLPVTVTGPMSGLSVGVNVADATRRAIRNKAAEELDRAIERNLGSIFKRKPKS